MHTYLIFCHSSNVLFAIFGCKCLLKQVLVNFKFSLMLISQGLSGKLLVTVNQHQTWINFGCPYISWSRSVHIIRGLYRIYQKKKDWNKNIFTRKNSLHCAEEALKIWLIESLSTFICQISGSALMNNQYELWIQQIFSFFNFQFFYKEKSSNCSKKVSSRLSKIFSEISSMPSITNGKFSWSVIDNSF